MPSRRVLVVEDFEPFQKLIRSTLTKRPEFQVVGIAADGLEAVRKAEDLQPDLITLDIGLPSINGIEAARRIRKLSPNSKILFMSQESAAEVAQEAFACGAFGYVVKIHAERELLAAVDAVIQGRQFVGSGLSGLSLASASDAKTLDQPSEPLPELAPANKQTSHSHRAEFYSDDAAFVAGLGRFIEPALESGSAVIVVATELHRKSLFQTLHENGIDMAAAVKHGRYVALGVADMLSTFMVDDKPDPDRFRKVVGDLVDSAAKASTADHPRVVACGECAPDLWLKGNTDAAIQVEHLCNDIARICNIEILCGYVLDSFQREQESHIFEKICAAHSSVSSL